MGGFFPKHPSISSFYILLYPSPLLKIADSGPSLGRLHLDLGEVCHLGPVPARPQILVYVIVYVDLNFELFSGIWAQFAPHATERLLFW